jgi:hypothetical protein
MPNAARLQDQHRRQLQMLEMYLKGRIRQLGHISAVSPGESDACNMTQSELTCILTQVLPEMREVLP